MAELTQIEKINITFKTIFGIQGLSNTDDTKGLQWYEEQYGWRPFIVNDDIFMQQVPHAATPAEADANEAANPSIIQKQDIKMSLVVGTNGRGWIALQVHDDFDSPVLADWLMPQLFGHGYALRLFQDDGTGTAPGQEITTTEGAWIPSYKLGFIILGEDSSAAEMGWTAPLWVRVYRYVGLKGVGGASAGVTLDDAYSAGNTIDANAGPVVINSSNSYASLQLTPVTYTPTESVAPGQVINKEGTLFLYDGTRNKWLSLEKNEVSYQTRNGDAIYLSTGNHSTGLSGFTALRNGTIVGVTASGGTGNLSKGFSIRMNGDSTDLYTFSLNGVSPPVYTSSSLDIDFDAGDILQVYCSAAGSFIRSPRVSLIIAWRE